jgi:hypothetical protein
MKKYYIIIFSHIFLIIFLFSAKNSFSQLYQGPANGSVPSGVIVNTNNFSDYFGDQISPYVRAPKNEEEVEFNEFPDYINHVKPTGPEGSNIIRDRNAKDNIESNPLLLHSFQGFNDPGNYIPPDQYCAVGPTHVMAVDNGRFRIWDKNGNFVKSINTTSWFSTTLSAASPFDPKIQYDHFNKRWIMVWLDQNNTRGYYLVSVSQDSIPLGNWYNWAIKSSLYGSTESGTWSDYEGVGFDNQALYITGRQFGFTGGYFGNKLRIIGKTQLYANTAGALSWTDMWDIRDPNNLSVTPDVIRPTVIYGTPSEYYFMCGGPFNGNNTYVILYKLTNPLTSPVLIGADVPVTAYGPAPNAQQLGGGMSIEAGGSAIRNEPIYRNGFLWSVHSVASGTGYSNVSYLKINPATNAAVEDASFGADPYYHFYTALAVDKDQNVLITYSRVSPNDYIGAYFTSRLSTDPPNTLNGSKVMQAGKSNYSKDFGSGRNRWGDYSQAWVDPADQNNFWAISQYAESPVNTWASWMANIRLVAFPGAKVYTFTDTLKFGNEEINIPNTDTVSLKVYNYGSAVLTISNIVTSTPNFQVANSFAFPVNMNYQDSITVKLLFRPAVAGDLNDTLKITSNDATTPLKRVYLKGHGYVIGAATTGLMYGVAGTQENGALVTINTSSGTGTTIGPTGYSQLTGLSIRKNSGQLYGTYSSSGNTPVVRVNAAGGDAFQVGVIPLSNVRAIAWDVNDVLYIGVTDGTLFRFNLSNNDTDLVGSTGITNMYGLSINPLNGQLWGINLNGGLYKINKQTAASTLLGTLAIGLTPALCFDLQGKMYVVKGIGTQVSDLYTVDTSTAAPTLIGTTGKKGINGIALSPNIIGIEPISNIIPDKFDLYQNYPNPFNPTTKVKFDIAKQTMVQIKIYDVTGRLVSTLVNKVMVPGRYIVDWEGTNYPSGVYFYHIEAGNYTFSRKMILIK